ncbi:ABC transporter substrate-binding protein [Roseimaritima ulvae]|uniref:Vitamin B12-binding protein n=1 Tax=Roseimaritima ulvae TaxID=980254 RepID=A0A5B9QW89_9BACT|nr:helical backbone metal receptor [Roseimaritima ulvae]QEG38213.1 Vitamin B12-binding protein precursor [Roseimaritima ulvae]
MNKRIQGRLSLRERSRTTPLDERILQRCFRGAKDDQTTPRRPHRLATVATLLTLIILAGCQKPSTPAANSAPDAPATITDRLDRSVIVDTPAKRIISLTPAMTELLFAMDLGPTMVGATKHCNYPAAALDIPRVGAGTLESISVEAIIAAKPDLVLCKWDYHQPLIETLDRMQIRCLAVGPQSLDELFDEADWIGRLTGHEAQAAALIERMTARRDHLTEVVARVQPTPPLKVFYEVWDDPLMTAGPDSFIDEMLVSAGLENIIRDTSIRYPRISAETVLRANPDLILAPTTHFEDVDVDTIRTRPGWDSVTAVQQQRIHLISGDEVSRCGPRLLDALSEIILAAYPELSPADLEFSSPSPAEVTR